MRSLFASIFTLFLSPVGLAVLAALDSSMVFYLPTAVEAALVILTARHRELFWVFPILAAFGSMVGASVTFTIGARIGEAKLKYWMPEHKLASVQKSIREKGAVPLALTALLPPPFPLAPLVLVCGAMNISRTKFLLSFGIARLVRFSIIGLLALLYGKWILRVMESEQFKIVAFVFAIIVLAGTVYSIYLIRRNARRHHQVA